MLPTTVQYSHFAPDSQLASVFVAFCLASSRRRACEASLLLTSSRPLARSMVHQSGEPVSSPSQPAPVLTVAQHSGRPQVDAWRVSFSGGRDLLTDAAAMDESSESEIARFYDGRSIFVTGATGFMGKVSAAAPACAHSIQSDKRVQGKEAVHRKRECV